MIWGKIRCRWWVIIEVVQSVLVGSYSLYWCWCMQYVFSICQSQYSNKDNVCSHLVSVQVHNVCGSEHQPAGIVNTTNKVCSHIRQNINWYVICDWFQNQFSNKEVCRGICTNNGRVVVKTIQAASNTQWSYHSPASIVILSNIL